MVWIIRSIDFGGFMQKACVDEHHKILIFSMSIMIHFDQGYMKFGFSNCRSRADPTRLESRIELLHFG